MMRRLAALPLLLLVAAAPRAEEDWGPRTARVALVEGVLLGTGPFDDAASELEVNSVLRGGDALRTEDSTFAEVELPEDAFLRLGPGA